MDINVYREHYEQESRHWWFRGRRKIVFTLLGKFLPLTPGWNILDVGCGTGGMLEPLKKYGNVIGVDESPEAIEFCKRNGLENTRTGGLRSVTKPGKMDLICYFDVLEHIPDDERELQEIFSRLKPGAWAVFTVPAFQFLWSGHDVVLCHQRRYTRPQLEQKLTGAGFRLIHSTYFNFFLFFPIAGFRLVEKGLGINRTPVGSDLLKTSGLVNRILEPVFSGERFFIPWMKFPFGVSIFSLVQRPDE